MKKQQEVKKYRNHFRNYDTFKKAIKTVKRENWADWIKIGKNWFTIEEYDDAGQYMYYSSLTANNGMHIEIKSSDRYSDKWFKGCRN